MGMARLGGRKPGLHDQAWHFLLGLGPDIAFLQEALPPAWIRTLLPSRRRTGIEPACQLSPAHRF